MNKMKKVFVSLGLAASLSLSGLALSATPLSPSTPKAQAVTHTQCTGAGMDGSYWCYQSNCNWWEYTFQGCRDGWVRFNTWSA